MPGSRFTEILRRRGTARLVLSALVARIPDSITATGIVVQGLQPALTRPADRALCVIRRTPRQS
jgi:hypothetical protein